MIDGVTPQYPKPRTPAYKIRIIGFFLGGALAAGLFGVLVWTAEPNSLVNRVVSLALPASFEHSFFLFQQGASAQVFTQKDKAFVPVQLGTVSPTLFMAHRDALHVSIQRTKDGEYEVRVNATMVYRSKEALRSASVSPDGTRVVVVENVPVARAENGQKKIQSLMVLVEPGKPPRLLGEGTAPFFVHNTELAWFSAVGLIGTTLGTSSPIRTLDADVRIPGPPFPPPAVSPDGTLIAWADPETRTVYVHRLVDDQYESLAEFKDVQSPMISLSNDALFALEQNAKSRTTKLWRYALTTGSAPVQIHGLPLSGTRLIQFIP